MSESNRCGHRLSGGLHGAVGGQQAASSNVLPATKITVSNQPTRPTTVAADNHQISAFGPYTEISLQFKNLCFEDAGPQNRITTDSKPMIVDASKLRAVCFPGCCQDTTGKFSKPRIHGACIRGCTELAIFDELCCSEPSLGRSEEHVGRRE